MAAAGTGRLESVNEGGARLVKSGNRVIETAIWKSPVIGPVPVRGVHVGGDIQADTEVHGGFDKAVYSYAREDYEWWAGELGIELDPGQFGENLTTERIDVSGAEIGEVWEVGTALLEVSEPRLPCFKLGLRMGDPALAQRFGRAGRPGAYLRIAREGEVSAGDEIRILDRPGHGVTPALVMRARLHDPSLAPRLLEAPQLSDEWREWAQRARSAPQ